MTLKRKRPDGSPMFTSPHRGLTAERVRYVGDPIALVIAETRGPGRRRRRAGRRGLRAPAVGDGDGGRRRARRARRLGRVPRQRLQPLRGRRQGGRGRRPSRARTGDPPALRDHARARAVHGAARGAWASGIPPRSATPSTRTSSIPTASATRSPAISSRCPSTVSACRGRRRRRLRHQGLAVPRAPAGALGRAPDRPARQVGLRAQRGHPRRRARARQRERGRAGLDADGRFLALRVRTLANVGAYVSSDRNLLATFSNVLHPGRRLRLPRRPRPRLRVFSNTNSTAPYRGAGRPEATYVIERMIDEAARELGVDRSRYAGRT